MAKLKVKQSPEHWRKKAEKTKTQTARMLVSDHKIHSCCILRLAALTAGTLLNQDVKMPY